MQLQIVNQDFREYLRGDILAVVADIHVWSPLELQGLWLAGSPIGLPDEYRTVEEGGSYPQRTAVNFPNPWIAVAQFPSYRLDVNLAEPWLQEDPDDVEATTMFGPRGWYLDLDGLPPGVLNSLEQPGGEASLGKNRLRWIKHRETGESVDSVPGWDSDITQGNFKHRHLGTGARTRVRPAGA